MGTRAAAFTAKIKNLNEIQLRLMQNSVPLPQGHEIANSLKYFSTTLLGVLRDVPGQPLVMIRCVLVIFFTLLREVGRSQSQRGVKHRVEINDFQL